jgi:hypothetical protein
VLRRETSKSGEEMPDLCCCRLGKHLFKGIFQHVQSCHFNEGPEIPSQVRLSSFNSFHSFDSANRHRDAIQARDHERKRQYGKLSRHQTMILMICATSAWAEKKLQAGVMTVHSPEGSQDDDCMLVVLFLTHDASAYMM